MWSRHERLLKLKLIETREHVLKETSLPRSCSDVLSCLLKKTLLTKTKRSFFRKTLSGIYVYKCHSQEKGFQGIDIRGVMIHQCHGLMWVHGSWHASPVI